METEKSLYRLKFTVNLLKLKKGEARKTPPILSKKKTTNLENKAKKKSTLKNWPHNRKKANTKTTKLTQICKIFKNI